MKRRQDWNVRLAEELKAGSKRPFKYGRHDCCTAVVRCLYKMTGENIMKDVFERVYRNESEAMALLEEYGGVSGLAEAVATYYGVKKTSIKRATEGDVVVVGDWEGKDALGIIGPGGRRIFAPKRPSGWATKPLNEARVVYKIP